MDSENRGWYVLIVTLFVISLLDAIYLNYLNVIANTILYFINIILRIILSNILSSIILAFTSFITFIAYKEEYQRPKSDPVSVEPIDSDNLEEGEFAFHVENVTGDRISGGSRFAVMPRNLTKDGDSMNLYRFGLEEVQSHLLGTDNALDGALRHNCPMYCHSPASQTDDWRGPWATYLPSEGGDRKKKISTHPFRIYEQISQTILHPVYSEGMDDKLDERVKSLVRKYNNQLKEHPEDTDEFSVEYDPDRKLECVRDCLFPTLNIHEADEMSVVLRNILKCYFTKTDGEWEVSKKEDHSI